jgi:hypothetical protein
MTTEGRFDPDCNVTHGNARQHLGLGAATAFHAPSLLGISPRSITSQVTPGGQWHAAVRWLKRAHVQPSVIGNRFDRRNGPEFTSDHSSSELHLVAEV